MDETTARWGNLPPDSFRAGDWTSSIGDAVGIEATAKLALAIADPDEALVRLTTALRAGLPGSQLGPGLFSSPLIAGSDPFEFFGSPDGIPPVDATVQRTQDLPRESLFAADAGAAATVDRRVALMTQDMAAFGGVGREASLRLDAPADGLRLDCLA